MELLIAIAIAVYLLIGVRFLSTFAWCLGMPASSCRTTKQKVVKWLAEWSMILFYPFWIIFMVGVLIAGK
ncbi:hypothetical protein KKP3262_000059 [Enterobacter phage KKP_3262]|nr:hypothetical protein KKP3262_000059 [Enterobacter phage KKP_3262]